MSEITYLASPYSHKDPEVQVQRFKAVAWEAARLIDHGWLVFCPISHSHPISIHGELEGGWQTWARQDFAMLQQCRTMTVLTLPGWEDSKGVTAELAMAEDLGIPLIWLAPSWDNPYV